MLMKAKTALYNRRYHLFCPIRFSLLSKELKKRSILVIELINPFCTEPGIPLKAHLESFIVGTSIDNVGSQASGFPHFLKDSFACSGNNVVDVVPGILPMQTDCAYFMDSRQDNLSFFSYEHFHGHRARSVAHPWDSHLLHLIEID